MTAPFPPLFRLCRMLCALALAAACADPSAPAGSEAWTDPAFDVEAATNVLHVPRDLPTIQAAVDAAEPGDIIQVARGVYHETVVITTSGIRLHGQNAVLDGEPLRNPDASPLLGIHVLGTAASPVTGIEISGFEVRRYERGIVFEWVQHSRIQGNDVHGNERITSALIFEGIFLVASSDNVILENRVHHNGHDGIQLRTGSSRNLIRANHSFNNGTQAVPGLFGCGINLASVGGGNHENWISENVVLDNHWGVLLIGPNANTGNVVAQNRIRGHVRAGVAILGLSNGNRVAQNDARGNGLGDLAPSGSFDLFDAPPTDNTWERNQGTANF